MPIHPSEPNLLPPVPTSTSEPKLYSTYSEASTETIPIPPPRTVQVEPPLQQEKPTTKIPFPKLEFPHVSKYSAQTAIANLVTSCILIIYTLLSTFALLIQVALMVIMLIHNPTLIFAIVLPIMALAAMIQLVMLLTGLLGLSSALASFSTESKVATKKRKQLAISYTVLLFICIFSYLIVDITTIVPFILGLANEARTVPDLVFVINAGIIIAMFIAGFILFFVLIGMSAAQLRAIRKQEILLKKQVIQSSSGSLALHPSQA